MIFVDSNVFIYAVGRPHPLRQEAQGFFLQAIKEGKGLVTSAEVLQELIHVYLPVNRMETLDAALSLAVEGVEKIIPVDSDTVMYARSLIPENPSLTARDLLHLSVCKLNKVQELMSFDRNLSNAFKKK